MFPTPRSRNHLASLSLFLLSCTLPNGHAAEVIDSILVVGNSITYHAPVPEIGWTGNWGMAATTEGNDYVHRLASRIALQQGSMPTIQIHATGGGTLAGKLADAANLSAMHAELIIVQMGENDTTVNYSGFQKPYDDLVALLQNANPQSHIVCTGVWKSPSRDALIKTVCTNRAVPLANISGVWPDIANCAASTGLWTNTGVGWHPSDSGMEGYANAIWNAFDFELVNSTPPTPAYSPVYPAANSTNFLSGTFNSTTVTRRPCRIVTLSRRVTIRPIRRQNIRWCFSSTAAANAARTTRSS
jgi:hypothetical protein